MSMQIETNGIQQKCNRSKWRKRFAAATVCLVALTTALALMIPAFGFTKEGAEKQSVAASKAGLATEITLPGGDDTYEVEVTFGSDAMIPDGATLDVKAIDKSSSKFEAAREEIISAKKAEDADFVESAFRMEALDITILDADGNAVEPAEGAEVSVSIKMKSLPEGASAEAVNSTMEVQHLNVSSGETVVETVADVSDVEVADGSVSAEFTLDSFSTFALTWTDGSATIHWGTINDDGSFNEFESAALDTSVGSVELRASYSGYEYVDAVCYTTEPAKVSINPAEDISDRTFINDVITKEAATGGADAYHWLAEDAQQGAQTFTVANGSHIYAVYRVPESPEPQPTPPGSDDIPTPTTKKSVTPNYNEDGTPDGTYTIELDITGAQIKETTQTGANVIIVYDISQSMSANIGGMTRLEASRLATHTLINVLDTDKNDIDLALITFERTATTRRFGGSEWTSDGSDVTDVIDGITNVGSNLGTNWHQALQQAYELAANPPDDDPTYVIFITDGCPSVNSFANNNDSHGANGTNNTDDPCYVGGLAYAKAIAGTKGTTYSTTASWRSGGRNYNVTISEPGAGAKLYGIYTGNDNTNLLNTLISSSGGAASITATSQDAITAAFQNIAQTIVNSLGTTDVTTTDGVTQLSSVSADISGAAGAFEYYRKGGKNEDGTEKYSSTDNGGLGETWSNAPGAIYNDDGSVTWDLSAIGQTEADVTYVIRFTVWPSQEAYDLIANLNNGAVDYDDLEPDVQDRHAEILVLDGVVTGNRGVSAGKIHIHVRYSRDRSECAVYLRRAFLAFHAFDYLLKFKTGFVISVRLIYYHKGSSGL